MDGGVADDKCVVAGCGWVAVWYGGWWEGEWGACLVSGEWVDGRAVVVV